MGSGGDIGPVTKSSASSEKISRLHNVDNSVKSGCSGSTANENSNVTAATDTFK